jgi:stearoyl-CoA desaturase (Delta-9 desaturase)
MRWFDASAGVTPDGKYLDKEPMKVDWVRTTPFFAMHGVCFFALLTGWSWTAVGVAFAMYWIRMFAITGIYHRYFSHRTYKTSRLAQFFMALWGGTCAQKGPLWWAAHHRHHHRHSDMPDDVHSPHEHGFLWAHMGWITSRKMFPTNYKNVPDLAKFPELVFLNRFDSFIPFLTGVAMFMLGKALEIWAPQLGTTGWQMLVWGFFISTVFLFHGTCTINSLAHLIGRKRYNTTDHSKNSFFLAIITMGEGWHNNHHHYPAAVRQGFYWWEIDMTYYILRTFEKLGIVWDLNPVPDVHRERGQIANAVEDAPAKPTATTKPERESQIPILGIPEPTL